jgi:hypothetical protein
MMRSLVLAVALMGLFVRPATAQQAVDPSTAPLPPTVVQNIQPITDEDGMSAGMGAAIGAASGVLALNVISGGLVLTPLIGVTASNILGGAWLGPLALLPQAAESVFHATSVAALAFTSGAIGYTVAGRD